MNSAQMPSTKEELMQMLETAFKGGQESMEGNLRFEHYGDHEPYAETKEKYGFKFWANQIWKYGLNKEL